MGEVFLTASNFCPRGTEEADGRLLPITMNTAMYSLLGTLYGGDGRTTFALPDLRGRTAVGRGQGPGLSRVDIGNRFGTESVVLSGQNLPGHATLGNGTPVAQALPSGGDASLKIAPAGGGLPVQVRDPSLGLMYCVVTTGIYPPRN